MSLRQHKGMGCEKVSMLTASKEASMALSDELEALACGNCGGTVDADRAARAPADSVLEDAARYRWLRQEHERVDPVCHLTWKRNLQRDSSEWVNTVVLDTAIDAARKQGANHD
jgi:hypothetical protein